MISWHGRARPPKEMDSKEDNAFVKISKTRNTIGALTTTMAQVCGLFTTQKIARLARIPLAQ